MSRNEPTPDEHRSPYVPNESAHPWRRMVAIGDSFTNILVMFNPTQAHFQGSATGI